jgi:hypothetical protein
VETKSFQFLNYTPTKSKSEDWDLLIEEELLPAKDDNDQTEVAGYWPSIWYTYTKVPPESRKKSMEFTLLDPDKPIVWPR